MRLGERYRFPVGLRRIEKHLAISAAYECREHRLRRGAVIRNQGTDLAATAARPDDAPGGKLPAAQ